jgi:hypothetical protein
VWVASRPGRFACGEVPTLPIKYKAVWTREPVWMPWRRENSLSLLEIAPRFLSCTARSIVTILTELSHLFTMFSLQVYLEELSLKSCFVVLPSSTYLFTAGVEVVYFHSITLRHTPQSVGLLWMRDRPVAETST